MTKTVLQVLPAMGVGGVERGTVEIASALVAAGWRAIVASAGGQGVKDLERVGAEHVELPLNRKSFASFKKNSQALASLVKKESVSLIHARSRAPAWSAQNAARTTGTPFVTTFHGVYGLGPLGLKKIYNRVMLRGRPVIAISQFIAEHIVKEYRVDPEDVVKIYRGVDLNHFDPASVTPARIVKLAKEWRLPDDGKIVMLPARLSRWKGHELLIDALAETAKRSSLPSNFRCLMVAPAEGTDSYRGSLEWRIQDSGLESHVQIIGNCKDIVAAYMVSDVIVSASSRPEAFGRVVAEAQAMGRPVIAPAHGAAPELLLPAVTGWLYTPGDAQSLSQALQRALELTPDERDILSQTAREHVTDHFSATQMKEQTLALYQSVLDHGWQPNRSAQST